MWTITMHYAIYGEMQKAKVFTGDSFSKVKTDVLCWEVGQAINYRNAFEVRSVHAERSQEDRDPPCFVSS